MQDMIKRLLVRVYRKVVPLRIRAFRLKLLNKKAQKAVLTYYRTHMNDFDIESKEDMVSVFLLVMRNGFSIFPEINKNRTNNYMNRKLKIEKEVSTGRLHVLLDDKKIFFPQNKIDAKGFRYLLNCLSLEQDYNSPHRYFSNSHYFIGVLPQSIPKDDEIIFGVDKGDFVVDAGAGEGNFSLSIIDKAEKVYLIESDPEWCEALKHTFANYKHKVEIIQKFLSDTDDKVNISLRGLVELYNIPKIDFIKIDVEGYERQVLRGGEGLLKTPFVNKIALCVYHKPEDETEFSQLVSSWGYQYHLVDGYMVFITGSEDNNPVRKGVLRAYRSIST